MRRFVVPRPASRGTVQLTALHESDSSKLLAYFPAAKSAMQIALDVKEPQVRVREIKLPKLDKNSALYDSAYANQFLLAAKNDDRTFSKIDVLDTKLKASAREVRVLCWFTRTR